MSTYSIEVDVVTSFLVGRAARAAGVSRQTWLDDLIHRALDHAEAATERPGHAFTAAEHRANPRAAIAYARKHERAYVHRDDGSIATAIYIPRAEPAPRPAPTGAPGPGADLEAALGALTLDQVCDLRVDIAMRASGGNVSEAARALGIRRSSLQRMLRCRGL